MDKKQIQKSIMQNLKTLRIKSLLGTETYINKQEVLDLVNCLDEKKLVELPVLPQFVAEAFDEYKESKSFAEQLIRAMYDYSDEVGYWLEVPSNEKLLLRAWLDGYEIEKEPLYYAKSKIAELPNWRNDQENYFNTLDDESTEYVWLANRISVIPRSKKRWKELNIDESIAIFEKVEV